MLKRPSELFHPRVQQAAELLGMSGAFPSGPFGSAEVLSALERLGLRSEVTRSAVLQSARSNSGTKRLPDALPTLETAMPSTGQDSSGRGAALLWG